MASVTARPRYESGRRFHTSSYFFKTFRVGGKYTRIDPKFTTPRLLALEHFHGMVVWFSVWLIHYSDTEPKEGHFPTKRELRDVLIQDESLVICLRKSA